MKSSILSRLLTGAVVLASATSALFAQNTYNRNVLIEQFTSATCGPCVAARTPMHNTVNLSKNVLSIRYHMNFPSPGDPWYVENPTDNGGRQSLYGINSIPNCVIDGNVGSDPTSEVTMANTITPHKAAKSPAYIKVWQDGGKAKVQVWSNVSLDSFTLNVVIVSRYAEIPNLPSQLAGSNGEKDWEDVMNSMLTGASGQLITGFAANSNKTYEFPMALGNGRTWPDNQQYIIAFLQDMRAVSRGAIIQSNCTRQAGDSTQIEMIKPSAVTAELLGSLYSKVDKGAVHTQQVKLTNKATTTNVVSLIMASESILEASPYDWSIDMPAAVTLAPNESATVDVKITAPTAHVQFNQFALAVSAQDGPGRTIPAFGLLTKGANYVVYNNLSGTGGDNWANAAIDASTGHKGKTVMMPYSNELLSAYPVTDFDVSVYNISYQAIGALATVLPSVDNALNAGKKVWIACESDGAANTATNPNADPTVVAFYNSTLGLTPLGRLQFVNNGQLSFFDATGKAGDPIGNGEVLKVNGNFTQAHQFYQVFMDVFQKTGNATVVYSAMLNDGSGGQIEAVVGVRYERSTKGRLYYTSICNEGLDGGVKQVAYTQRVMDWLTGAQAANPVITVNRQSVTFGSVQVGNTRDESVIITNTGSGDLRITAMYVDGLDASVFTIGSTLPTTAAPLVVAAGAKATVTLKFAPTAEGAFTGRLNFTSNATTPASVALSGSGGTTGVIENTSISGAIGLKVVGANPIVSTSAIELRSTQPVTLKAINSNGVLVATLFEGTVNGVEKVSINANALPSGAYTIVADNGSEATSVSVVIAR